MPEHRFWGDRLESIARLPVQIAGDWSVESTRRLAGGAVMTRRWRGHANANKALVALAVLSSPTRLLWGKSEVRPDHVGCPIEIALFPHPDPPDVQVNVMVGGGGYRRHRMRLDSLDYVPAVDDARDVVCGELVRLVVIAGEPTIEVGFLFIARDEVRKGRTGNWKPRSPEAATSLLARMISGPKSGSAARGGKVLG